jgi:hypothetical protein
VFIFRRRCRHANPMQPVLCPVCGCCRIQRWRARVGTVNGKEASNVVRRCCCRRGEKSSKGSERSGRSRRCPSESLSLRWHGCRGAGGSSGHGQPWSQSARQERCEPRIRDRAATCPGVSQTPICCGGEEPREQRVTHHRLAPECGKAMAMKPGDRWRVVAGRGRPRARVAA